MPVNTKAINRRIKSVKNTKKITKAMEMVAASKMRKATQAALNTREYAGLAWDLLVKLSKKENESLPLLKMRPVKKMLVILITSNRGLCGSFNSNIIKKTSQALADKKNISKHRLPGGEEIAGSENIEIDVIAVGKKGIRYCKKMGYNVIAAYTDISEAPKLDNIMPLSKTVIDDYISEKYDKVVVAYTDFRSSLVQEAKLRQVLPVSQVDIEKMLSDIGGQDFAGQERAEIEKIKVAEYLFEPNKKEVLSVVLPRLVETQIYQALLESCASEHSARMLAMRNASEAADEMIDDLTLTFNKARQAAITQEISEIVGGVAALE
ncbi:ATP synthase F1 subunit gamma [Patescibacteria group bacterium]|nr:ATP synthase F1 subunit gamma [Patescibacteria group bacterium]